MEIKMKIGKNWILALILIISFIVQLFIAFRFEGTGDSGGWRLAGKTGLEGEQFGLGKGTVYEGDCPLLCGNWPPLTYHYYVGMRWVYENINPMQLPQWGFYKLIPALASVGIAYLLYKFALFYNLKNPIFFSAIYAFHPLTFYVSAYHGQRESVWLFLLLLSLYFFVKLKRYFWFAVLFAFSVSVKLPPLLFAPFLFLTLPKKREKIFFIISVPLAFFLLSLPEIVTHTENIFKQVFLYKGASGWWGFTGLATKIDTLTGQSFFTSLVLPINKFLQYFAIIVVSIYFHHKKIPPLEGILGIIMVTFVFSSVFASQYMLWPLPFLILLYDKYKIYFWLFSAISLYIAMNSYGFFGIQVIETILTSVNTKIYSLPFYSHPLEFFLYFPLWIMSFFLLVKIIKNHE